MGIKEYTHKSAALKRAKWVSDLWQPIYRDIIKRVYVVPSPYDGFKYAIVIETFKAKSYLANPKDYSQKALRQAIAEQAKRNGYRT